MKIFFVITGLGMGGAEHVVTNLADQLVILGHEVKIAYLTGETIVLPENSNIELISIGLNSSKDFLRAYVNLRNEVKEFRPDVVHSHMFHSNIIARLLRLTVKFPHLITTAHNTTEGNHIRMMAYRLTDKLADISTNVSAEAVESFVNKRAVKSGRMITIANGIDVKKFQFDLSCRASVRKEFSITNEKILLSVGRLDVQKDYSNLLNAIVLLKKTRQDFRLFIAGDGPLRNELYNISKELNIEEFVRFLGVRNDIPALMSAADIFVLPSAWEGFGLVVAEAMACERFVVATDCGGVKEVVGENGFLVEPKNHVALAEQLDKALELDDSTRLQVGYDSRKHIIKNYSLNKNVDSYLNLYLST